MTSRDYFRNKRVALIGLGPHGEMVADARFMIKQGAVLSVYDMKSEARLKNHLLSLRGQGLANYVCGQIPPDDLADMDLIILSHEYSRDTSFLRHIQGKNIPIEYPETLFFKLAPPVTLIGIMGTCGKTTVLSMLAPMFENVCGDERKKGDSKQNFFIVDPDAGDEILGHVRKMQNGDIVLMRIVEPMMRELHAMRISPHVAVFTTMPPKNAYDDSPFEILEYQTYNNFIIGNDKLIDAIRVSKFHSKAKMFRTKSNIVPKELEFSKYGHDKDNAALAIQTAQLFKINEEVIFDVLAKWKPLKNHLELVKKVKGIEFYNDSASVSPEATLAGAISLSENNKLLLILGGADGGYDYGEFMQDLPKYAKDIILLPGSGTLKERKTIGTMKDVNIASAPSLEEAVRLSFERATKGDKILFSPAFLAGGFDISRRDRGERFVRAVRSL